MCTLSRSISNKSLMYRRTALSALAHVLLL